MNKSIMIKTISLIMILIVLPFMGGCGDDGIIDGKYNTPIEDRLYVWNNISELSIINTQSLEVERILNIDFPEGFTPGTHALSSDGDFIIFSFFRSATDVQHGFLSYDLNEEKTQNVFYTELNGVGAPRIAPAYHPDNPGLFYFYSFRAGFYSYDFIEMKLIETFDSLFDEGNDMMIWYSSGKEWRILARTFREYEDMRFYDASEEFDNLLFTLNKDNTDGVHFDDFYIPDDFSKLYFSNRFVSELTGEIENNLRVYDLETKNLVSDSVQLRSSLNPYYMAYSHKRDELYLIGRSETLYIIDLAEFTVKDSIRLEGKFSSTSRITLRADEKIAFISSSFANTIFVVDLEERNVVMKISVSYPYRMLLRR